MLNFIVVLTALTQGLVGLFVFLKRRGSLSNSSFAMLSLVNLAWALTNYIYTLNPVSDSALGIIRFVIFLVVVENTLFYIFAKTYPANRHTIPPRTLYIVLAASALVAILALTPGVFKSVTVVNNQSNPNPGPLIPLFILHAIYTIGGGLRSLLRKLRASHGQERHQFQYIIFASVLNWLVVPVTNFVITLTIHTTFFARVSPFYTLAFAAIIAYAIVAQKMFDIKAAVARSVAYVLLLTAVIGIYGLLIFGLVDSLTANPHTRQILSLLLGLALAFEFHSFKVFFDRITNRLFYRDSYDAQEVLDQLGSLMVAEIDLHKILDGTRQTLSSALKVNFVEFILIENGQPTLKISKDKGVQEAFPVLSRHLREQRKDVLDTEESLHSQLRPYFSQSGVAVSLRLKTQQQVVGFILFGDKRSGDVYSSQDLKMLAIIANELSVAVQNALRFEQIQQFNITLQQKVDDATKQLRHANSRLKELDATKDEFISMASHQLRTPLTSIKGYLSMVLEGDVGAVKKDQRKMLQQAFDSAEQMVFLIADLLNVSRLQSGKFVIENKPTDLAKMVSSEVDRLAETAMNHGVTLTPEIAEKFPILNIDENKIRQVVMNFIDNAIYYTPSGGTISVKLEAGAHNITYTVTDTGLGVPAAVQHKLFSKFYRADNARKMRPDGTGLGLFMAKKVIVAQGGAIIFKSTEGKGSTFGFSFPRSEVELKDQEASKSA
jgi:signal transduction histidine kinase